MSTKENNEVAVEKVTENDKASADAKCDIKGIKRPAEVSTASLPSSYSDSTHILAAHGKLDVYYVYLVTFVLGDEDSYSASTFIVAIRVIWN